MTGILSIIIPTRNRAEYLHQCLKSIQRQRIGKDQFEVIVIDNGSTDQTKEVVHLFNDSLKMTYFFESSPGLHIGRHKGLQLSRTDILAFIDDDIIAPPHWVEGIITAFKDPDVVMVGGNNLPKFERVPPPWLKEWWAESSGLGKQIPFLSILDFGSLNFRIDPHYIWGCNFSIRKKIIIDAGGFHPDALPFSMLKFRGDGETHISQYVKENHLKAVFNANASVYHTISVERLTLKYFDDRAFAQGISNSYTSMRKKDGLSLLSDIAKMVGGLILRSIKVILTSPEKTVLCRIKRDLHMASIKGFFYHQYACRSDKRLKDWVFRDTYY